METVNTVKSASPKTRLITSKMPFIISKMICQWDKTMWLIKIT